MSKLKSYHITDLTKKNHVNLRSFMENNFCVNANLKNSVKLIYVKNNFGEN